MTHAMGSDSSLEKIMGKHRHAKAVRKPMPVFIYKQSNCPDSGQTTCSIGIPEAVSLEAACRIARMLQQSFAYRVLGEQSAGVAEKGK